MSTFKITLHQACLARIDQSIAAATQAMEDAQNSANQETKSSVGDKYETGRAMMQLEKDKFAQQLAQSQELRLQLEQLNPSNGYSSSIQLGSLLRSNEGYYYLAVSLGKIMHEGKAVYVLSAAAPLGQVLLGKKVGDKIQFQGRRIEILELW
ncbi:3-oxoacyl-ACP synthase [Haliscomenobacter sp.]|uniref:3-oxoacyl-ACP synthase n=1 Tax=Haliscomenobacter sp. TaxID=2717303 RepID=UPI0035947A5B